MVTARRAFGGLSVVTTSDELIGVADAASSGVVPASRLDGRPLQRAGDQLEQEDRQRRVVAGRFRHGDAAGDRIPGAVEEVVSIGTVVEGGRWSASARLRHIGPRPLVEDGSVRSRAATTLSAGASYALGQRWRIEASVFNLLGAEASDVEYFYTSRLPGEPEAGVDDVHLHPLEPRSLRVGEGTSF